MNINVDKLKICYTLQEDSLIHFLREHSDTRTIDWGNCGFRLEFVEYKRNKYIYNIVYVDYIDNTFEEIKEQTFGIVSFFSWDDAMERYAWIEVDNRQFYFLYDNETINRPAVYIDYIADTLGLNFNNISSLDIALDSDKYNFSKLLKRFIHRNEYIPLINGRAKYDRKEWRDELVFAGTGTLEGIKEYTTYIYQAKAKKKKEEGIILTAYNKMREIKHQSHKTYIQEAYGDPKKIHRLEIRINSSNITTHLKKNRIEFHSLLLCDIDFLLQTFKTFLDRMIRFRTIKGRHTYSFLELLQ
jgi:hypothetical protein